MRNYLPKHWPAIRKRAGRDSYVIDCGEVDGKRTVYYASTLSEAKARAADLRVFRESVGKAVRQMSPADMLDAAEARMILPDGVSMVTAAKEYAALHVTGGDGSGSGIGSALLSLQAAVGQWIAAKEARGLRGRSVDTARQRVGTLVRSLGTTAVVNLTDKDLETCLAAAESESDLSARTRSGIITAWRDLFSFCVRRGYIAKSAADALVKPRVPRSMPEFLTVNAVRGILQGALLHYPNAIPKLALGFFGGLRTEELHRLTWENVKLDDGFVLVEPEQAKMGVARHVAIMPALRDWLVTLFDVKACHGLLPLTTYEFDAARRAVCEEYAVRWPQNAMRHTFATYHMAAFQDAGKTAFELGHTGDSRLLYRHYRGLATKEAADEFWALRPENVATATVDVGTK